MSTGERWAQGLDEEVEFWHRWLRNHGEPWGGDYVWRTDPESPLQPRLRALLPSGPRARLRILDVGSGPLTILGKRWGERVVEITAVDPLADRYHELFEQERLRPLVMPVKGEAERLDEILRPMSFDLAYARNCLDHGYDPLRAIRQMLRMVVPGGVVLLDHVTDEGEFMTYSGPHQWNFRVDDGRFVIWQPGLRIDAHAELEPEAKITTAVAEDDSRYMSVTLRKHQPTAPATGSVFG